jgi:crotonobetainyl-CoA:carnitine CoA-transferase CaiB-like acyl-CoA transferase
MKVGVAISDLITGLYAANAIQAAIIHQARTGEGQSIDMALFDCQAAALANQAMNYLSGGMLPTRLGNAHPNIVPYQVFSTQDGHLILAIANDGQFRRFCKAAGFERLGADPRYATNAFRVDHREQLIAELTKILAARSTADWIALLESANVPCGPINRIDQVFSDPQAEARGLRVQMVHRNAGPITLVASPLRLEKTPPEYRSAPPLLGEHTHETLSGLLGLAEDKIADLAKQGIVGVC